MNEEHEYAVIYARQEMMHTQACPIPEQVQDCLDYARANKLTVVGIYSDVASGYTFDKYGFNDVLTFLGQHRGMKYVLITDQWALSLDESHVQMWAGLIEATGAKVVCMNGAKIEVGAAVLAVISQKAEAVNRSLGI